MIYERASIRVEGHGNEETARTEVESWGWRIINIKRVAVGGENPIFYMEVDQPFEKRPPDIKPLKGRGKSESDDKE